MNDGDNDVSAIAQQGRNVQWPVIGTTRCKTPLPAGTPCTKDKHTSIIVADVDWRRS